MITEEDFIDFACPYCGEANSFPMQQRGSLQQCPMCMEALVVPAETGEPGRKVPVPFSTERLILRRLAPGDWKDLLEILSDEETFRYMPGHPLDEESILKWLESDPHVRLTTVGQMFWLGIMVRDSGKLTGLVGLQLNVQDMQQASVTVQVNRAFQNQGIATAALAGVLTLCFNGIHLHRVSASCDSRNGAALKLLEKVRLRREGEFVKDSLVQGQWTNTVWHAVLAEEFGKR